MNSVFKLRAKKENISSKLDMTLKLDRQHNQKTEIVYSIVDCDLGYLLLGNTFRGICAVKLGDRAVDLVQTLNQEFGSAANIREDRQHPEWINQILDTIKGREKDLNFPLDIRSTPFQKQVWQTLQKIPYGETRTYKEVAQELGKPQATRAVGNACSANPVALLIPCHRVLRSDGSLGGYRWGIERKQKLLAIEQHNNQEHQ